jgi:hypothetical protein
MLVFSYSPVGPPNLDSRPFCHSIPHPPTPISYIHDPHAVVLFLHLVAVITCVVLVLFSHDHPDKKEVALYAVE